MTRLLISWHLTHGGLVRASFCAIAIMLAFFLFVLTDAIGSRLERGNIGGGDDRLMVVHKFALSESLPAAYRDRIAAVPGVTAVAPRHLFNGWFRDATNNFTQYLVDPVRDLALHPEYAMPVAQRDAFLAGGKGVLVGQTLARRYGWKVGDNLSLGSTWLHGSSVETLAVTVVGIFEAAPQARQVDTDVMLIDKAYFSEVVPFARNLVGWFVVGRAPGSVAPQVAGAIDALFEHDSAPTATSTERAMSQRMAQQLGDVTRIGLASSIASFWSLMFAVGLYFWQNMTQRAQHIAVLRAIGFTHLRLFGALLGGSMMLSVGAALAGCLLAALALPLVASELDKVLPGIEMDARTWYRAVAIMLMLGLFGACLAALRMRFNTATRFAPQGA